MSDGTYGVKINPQCTDVTDVVIPSTYNNKAVTTIVPNGFANCIWLKSVEIPRSIAHIQTAAFTGCAALEEITIPREVETIGENAFYGSGLKRAVFENMNWKINKDTLPYAYSCSHYYNGEFRYSFSLKYTLSDATAAARALTSQIQLKTKEETWYYGTGNPQNNTKYTYAYKDWYKGIWFRQ